MFDFPHTHTERAGGRGLKAVGEVREICRSSSQNLGSAFIRWCQAALVTELGAAQSPDENLVACDRRLRLDDARIWAIK
jgi:hypothetical protein